MAWRDSRRNRMRLLLFMSSIILGIAALVALDGFDSNLRRNINDQSKELLGADLVVNTNVPLNAEQDSLLNTFEAEKSAQADFASMVLFPKTGNTRLVNVKALEGDFPYFGKMVTEPAAAAQEFRTAQKAVVDRTLMLQFNAEVGDKVKVGELEFEIAGKLKSVSGQAGVASTVAPAVYIPKQYLEQTQLIQMGSRADYSYYFKLNDSDNINPLIDRMRPEFKKHGFRFSTVEGRRENIDDAFGFANKFLNLVAFIALLLGCVGVASSVHVYLKGKEKTVAVLRCLGVSGWQAFLIFLIQIMTMGFLGSVVGAILGSLIQMYLPTVFQSFLPVEVQMYLVPSAIGKGILVGVVVSLLFALLPLLKIRKIPPLKSLRVSATNQTGFDALTILVYGVIVAAIFGFALLQTNDVMTALAFCGFLVVAFLILTGVSYLIMWSIRKFFPRGFSYVFRQGLSNLYRPNNQTLVLMVCIGLGTALISTLFFIQSLLLGQVEFVGRDNQPNMIVFDIQSDQIANVTQMAAEQDLPILQQVPIVTMSVAELNGRTVADLRADTTNRRRGLTREARVTFRDSLTITEQITSGEFVGEYNAATDDTIFISIAERFQKMMDLNLGDELVFDVQGTPVKTVVGSTRKVDWQRMASNFFIVFPKGVLEEAPQFYVMVTRVPDNAASARFQQSLVSTFPNVSVVDLTLILRTVDDLLSKVSFVIQFMAFFSIITGLLVLIGSVIISRFQRIKESVLLRTLGGSRKQILWINITEYFILGSLASLTGIVLALGGSWLLAFFVFKMSFVPNLLPIFLIYIVITGLTVIIGLANSRGVLSRPPLEVLRSEV